MSLSPSFGDVPGTSDSKREETVADSFQDKAMCTLHSSNVTTISKDSTGGDALNTRERDTAVIKGFKVCMELSNQSFTLPMYFNMAVVVPRDASTVNNDDFFRAQAGDTRTANFSPGDLSANQLHCLPINSDKYIVLKHKRFRIEPNQVVARGNQYRNVDFYQSIQKQFRWDDVTATPREDVFLLYWASYFSRTAGTLAASGENDTTENFSQSLRIVTYFGDPSEYQKMKGKNPYGGRKRSRTK